MEKRYVESGKFKYQEAGTGKAIILLHGLMGGLSNFDALSDHFSSNGYRVLIPSLPLYDFPLLRTNVKAFAQYLKRFIDHLELEKPILMGNSLGGHIALVFNKLHPNKAAGLVLAGSSGLYENSMGESYPKREDYNYIKSKTEEVFYDPKTATKELVDEVFETVNDRSKLIKVLTIAKSAIRHNMASDLPKMKIPVVIIWGTEDNVTPPNVAKEFHKLLPNSELHWIEKCGHAPMMEQPEKFNAILSNWLQKNNF